MRKGWKETTLGAHIKIVMGQAPPGKDCNKDGVGVPFVKAGEFTDGFPLVREWTTNPLKFSKLGDTLICVVGATCGKLSKGIDCAIGRSVAALQPLETLDGGFLWNFMARKVQEMRDGSRGSAQGVITKDDLADLPLGLPPLEEQKRIVDVVSSVDAYIAALQQQADSARVARDAVLHELLSAGGDDWTESTLGEIITLEYGKPLKAENRDGKGFPVFGSAGEVGLHSKPLVNEAPVIVVGRKGTAGAVWWSDLPCSVIDTAFYVVQKIETDIRFLYFILGYLDLPSLTAQTGVPGLNRDRAYSSQVLLPPIDEQKRIVEIVSSMDDVIQGTEQAVMNAKALRSGLLSDLLSGEHEIPASYDSSLGAA